MAIIESFAISITATIAKHMLSKWLGDGWASQVSSTIVDQIKTTVVDRRKASKEEKQIDDLAAKIVEDMTPWVAVELRKLEPAEGRLAIEEATQTLSTVRLTSEKLVEMNMDGDQLLTLVESRRPDATALLSANASALYERLLAETSRAIIRFAPKQDDFASVWAAADLQRSSDIDSLIRRLLEGPDRRAQEFERHYCEAVVKRLDRMELFGLQRMDHLTECQSLSIAFVNITMESSKKFVSYFNEISTSKEVTDFQANVGNIEIRISVSDICEHFSYEKSTYSKLYTQFSQLLEKYRSKASISRSIVSSGKQSIRTTITGRAGSGKSTLLQWLAIQYAKNSYLPAETRKLPRLIPFFIRLRQYVGKDFPSPEEFVHATAPVVAGAMPDGWVHSVLDQGRALVLIDGVDEIPQAERHKSLRRIQELVAAYPWAHYIVTSRPAAVAEEKWPEWLAWTRENGFLELVLQDMTDEQANSLIDRWHEAVADSTVNEEERLRVLALPDSLKRQLVTRPEIRRLTVNPLLCAMLCAVHHDRRQNLPRERARLYEECVQILLNRRDLGRGVDVSTDYPDLGEAQKEALARSVAYWFLQNGYSSASVEDIDRHFSSLLRLMQISDATGENVRLFFVERTDLLREPVVNTIDFAHRTFMEYLAAKEAVANNDFGVLLKNVRDDQWRETLILAVGEARPQEAAKFLRDLIKKADNYRTEKTRHQLYLLAVACLETPVQLDPSVTELVLNRAERVIPPISQDEVQQIAKGGSPIVPLLAPNDDYSRDELKFCISALGEIGTEEALEMLVRYTQRGYAHAVRNLPDVWHRFDRNIFLERVLSNQAVLDFSKSLPTAAEFQKLLHLTELHISNSEFDQVEILKELYNLEWLIIANTKVKELQAIESLAQLQHLRIQNTNVTSLEPLSKLTQLCTLFFGETQVTDLTPLVDLPHLRQIHVEGLSVSDWSVLEKFTCLNAIHIDLAQLKDLTCRQVLRNISDLSVHFTSSDHTIYAETLAQLQEFADLRSLYLSALNHDSNLKWIPFGKLTRLILSSLRGNLDLAALSNLEHLKQLHVWSESVTNVQSIRDLRALTELYWSAKTELDLELFSTLKNLRLLDIGLLDLDNLAPLSKLENLESLSISVKTARNLGVVAEMPNLKTLEVYGSGRIDRDSLRKRPDIKVVRY